MPRRAASGRILRPLRLPSSEDRSLDLLVGALRPSTAHLRSLPVVHDGNPNVDEDKCCWADDFRDDVPDLELYIAEPIPAVMAKDVKVILFDCNILIVSEMNFYLNRSERFYRIGMDRYKKPSLKSFLRRSTCFQ
jgi:hypothetical protein